MTLRTKTVPGVYTSWHRYRSFGHVVEGQWTNWINSGTPIQVADVTKSYGPDYAAWKDRIRSHQQATTYLKVSGVSYRDELNFANVGFAEKSVLFAPIGKVHRFEMDGRLGSPSAGYPSALTLGSPSTSRAHNAVISAFVKKAIKAQRQFSGGVALGELRETLHLIRHPLSALRHGFDDYLKSIRRIVRPVTRKGRLNLKKLQKLRSADKRKDAFHRIVSDTWLEFSFGIQPLVSDVDDGLQALAKTLNYVAPTKFISVVAGETFNITQVKNDLSHLNMVCRRVYERSNTYSERLYGVVEVENGLSAVGQDSPVLRRYGIDLRSVVPTLWELIPYSFLVDYFTNIGDIIDAACFNRASVRWMAIGKRHEQTLKLKSFVFEPSVDFGYKMSEVYPYTAPSFEYTYFELERDVYAGTLIPSLEFSLDLNIKQRLNIAALGISSRYTSRLSAKALRL